jgi:hypothetical protein
LEKVVPVVPPPKRADTTAAAAEHSKLSRAWKSYVNKRALSDVTIYAKNERPLYAHKLVLHVRCPAILSETIKECGADGACSEMLVWMEYDYETVRVFLEYVYSGELADVKTLNEQQRRDLKALSSIYDVAEVRSAVEQLEEDDVVRMTEGERNLRLLELELETQPIESPVGSPEMFPGSTDESIELCITSPMETSYVSEIAEKRKSPSPLSGTSGKKLRFDEAASSSFSKSNCCDSDEYREAPEIVDLCSSPEANDCW